MSRALVLSGGGVVGTAWQSGLIAGFARGGADLSAADYILGTSAGAIVGARLALGAPAAALADLHLNAPVSRGGAPASASPGLEAPEDERGTRSPAEARRALGAWALAAETMSEAEFLALIGEAVPEAAGSAWPERPFACTAIDAAEGGFQLWEARSGVELLPAVASSCAVPGMLPPVTLQGRRYMDGGVRSTTNADLAAGHDLVVVISVQYEGAHPSIAARLAEEVESLKACDATVVTITPEAESLQALGADLMDGGRRAAAARAGLAQGLAQAEILKPIWG